MGNEASRLLLVEDDDGARLSLAYLLEDRGFAVAQAAAFEDAVRHLLSTARFDAVVADQHLGREAASDGAPERSGACVLRQAARLQPEAGRLLLTGDADVRREGDAPFVLLFKPVSPEVVLGLVARMAENARRARERRRIGTRPTDPALPAVAGKPRA